MFAIKKSTLTDQKNSTAAFDTSAFEGASLAMMMVDRDLNIVRINKASAEIAQKHADDFRKLHAGFDPEKMIGLCIDVFHANPAHQRRILSDPNNLPYNAKIRVGETTFNLQVGAVMDRGEYIGAVLEWADVTHADRNQRIIDAAYRSQAVIEFTPDGTIVSANDAFLAASGYSADEIVGEHHSIFVTAAEARTPEYKDFWAKLARGDYQHGEFRRVTRNGDDLWLQASYNPIIDRSGKTASVIKFATDITEQKQKSLEDDGKLAAAGRSQAMIEFDPSGVILDANDNFLSTLGYGLSEIVGKHHSMFVDPAEAESAEYQQFWGRLRAGEFQTAKYRRIGKGGKEIWIRASYNPIFDVDGETYKVVKFAADITQEEQEARKRAAEQETIVSELATGLGALAEGRLSVRIETKFAGEYDKLRDNFNDSVARLQDALNTVAATAGGMANGVDEIARSSDDMSKRTERQAATLEETAAALDEITATVRQTAESAAEANDVVAETNGQATKSGEVVREAVSAMGEISKSSDQISQIIGVIDEIAFQTNLLALNAGVEAARAGDAGRGFAVVAQEVRALAQRSSEAAKEIKGLISASSAHVKSGVDLVGRTGEALGDIVVRVESISTLVREIALSAQEQSTSLGEVNTAMNQMDEVTQQNAAMVEEATAAAQSLGDDADVLRELLAQFDLGAETSGHAASQASIAPAASAATPDVRRQQSQAADFAVKRAVNGAGAAAAVAEDWSEF